MYFCNRCCISTSKRCYDPYFITHWSSSDIIISNLHMACKAVAMSLPSLLDTLGPEIEDPEEGSYSLGAHQLVLHSTNEVY
jgi:hypothetical protein